MADAISLAHQRQQLALRAGALRDLLRLWPAFDVHRIAQTWPAFSRAALVLVRANGRISSGLAARYFREHRRAAGVPGMPPPPKATPTAEQIVRGLASVAVVEAGQALALGRQAEVVANATLAKVSGAVGMYVLDFGRDTLVNMVRSDSQALGWARATSGDPCAFCAMLASRGPVYQTEETANFEAHRACACMPVPQWDRDQEWPAGSRDLKQVWSTSTRGLGGKDALNAFRRTLEGR